MDSSGSKPNFKIHVDEEIIDPQIIWGIVRWNGIEFQIYEKIEFEKVMIVTLTILPSTDAVRLGFINHQDIKND